METDTMTLQRFVLRDQRNHPTATGDLTNLLTSLLTAIKVRYLIFRTYSNNADLNHFHNN